MAAIVTNSRISATMMPRSVRSDMFIVRAGLSVVAPLGAKCSLSRIDMTEAFHPECGGAASPSLSSPPLSTGYNPNQLIQCPFGGLRYLDHSFCNQSQKNSDARAANAPPRAH